MLKMLRDQILVKPVKRQQSELIEVISSERYNIGIVMAAGPGKEDKKGRRQPLDVKVGDHVRYGEFGFQRYTQNQQDGTSEDYLIMQEADVAGVINGIA